MTKVVSRSPHLTIYPKNRSRSRNAIISFALIVLILTCGGLLSYLSKSTHTAVLKTPFTSLTTKLTSLASELPQSQQSSISFLSNQFIRGEDDEDDKEEEDEEEEECANIDKQADKCEFVREFCDDEAGIINYLELHYCYFEKASTGVAIAISILIFGTLLFILLSALGNTADIFFVPSLGLVSTELKLSPSVAGLTFLALGNGSPDILTTISGVRQGDFEMVLASLNGASVCIMLFVVGSVIFFGSEHGRISKRAFWRNLICFALAIISMIAICGKGFISIYESITFLALYAVYVIGSVIYLQYEKSQDDKLLLEHRKRHILNEHIGGPLDPSLTTMLLADHMESDISSESLLLQASVQSDDLRLSTLAERSSDYVMHDDGRPHLYRDVSTQSKTNYDVIESDDIDDDEEDDLDQTYFMEGLTCPHPEWEEAGTFYKLFLQAMYILTLPFSLFRWLSIPSTNIRPDYLVSYKLYFTLLSPIGLSQVISLSLFELDYADHAIAVSVLLLIGIAMSVFLTVYYFRIVLPSIETYNDERARVRVRVDELTSKLSTDLTPEELTEISDSTISYDLDKRDEDAKPRDLRIFQIISSLLAFVGSVAWLSLFADEIVAILTAFGLMFGLSTTILGLTVLAIGNSMPDFISNVALAKGDSHKTEIAYASMFSAPLFTTLCGLGIALTISTIKTPRYTFSVTGQIIATWCAVGVAIISHAIIYPIFNYKPPRWYGVMCTVAYLAFLGVAVSLEIFS